MGAGCASCGRRAQRWKRSDREYVARLVPDAVETVAALQAAGVDVRIISGGLLPAVLAVARAVGVDASHVAAVDITFNDDGSYAGFDAASPLTMSGGKAHGDRAVERRAPGD